jgi:multidrug efflux pump subunit AcrA (membrane-fusion protein)
MQRLSDLILMAAAVAVALVTFEHTALRVSADEKPAESLRRGADAGEGLRLEVLARAAAEARVPALERGSLKSIVALPGAQILRGSHLGSLDDREAALTVELAERDLEAARHKRESSKKVEIAEAAVQEGRRQLDEATEEAQATEQAAVDESSVQLARKMEELADDRLERARVARGQSERSVPAAEWFALQNERDQAEIRTAAAERERAVAALRARAAHALVERQRASLQRLELQLMEAKADREAELIQLRNLQTTLEIARARFERRQLMAPCDGVVVEQFKQPGEWCEAGEAVLRVLQLNPLHLEGFAPADTATLLRPGQEVSAELIVETRGSPPAAESVLPRHKLKGRLIFVSPEVDALNRQVRIRAEVDNPELRVRPGENLLMHVQLKE